MFILLIGISIVQFILYSILYKKIKKEFPNILILIGILITYYTILPQFFFPEPREDGINCGLPAFGITFAFWVFGTIAGLSTHIIWLFWKSKRKSIAE